MVEKSLLKYKRVVAHLTGDAIVARLDRAMHLLEPTYKKSILVNFRDKIVPIKTDDIQYVYAAKGNLIIHQADNQDYIAGFTIDQLEKSLNPAMFFRANRQFLISRDVIENIEHYFNRRLVVKTSCNVPEKVIVSRDKSQEFLKWMER